MQASSKRPWHVRLALMLMVGVAAAAACVVTLLWWKAPAASGQDDETVPTEESFVVKCEFHDRLQVDPIVGMGHHMHDFFGNTTIGASSTYDTLRAGGTTCDDPGDTAAYWIPTLSWTDSSGAIERTASITRFYYRLGGKSPNVDVNPHPALDTDGNPQDDRLLDDGLKIVTVQGKNVEWRCFNGTWSTKPPSRCTNGKLVVRVKFPDCLAVAKDEQGQPIIDPTTGKQIPLLDSPDHRSHMVDSVRPENALKDKCPSIHPYSVPMLQTNIEFPIPTTRGTPTLSSGAYSTMHADFFNAWDQARLEHLVETCLNNEPFTASYPKPEECF